MEIIHQLQPSKTEDPTLLIGEKAIHSKYDPRQDAQRHAKRICREITEKGCDHIVGIGGGLGYLQEALVAEGITKGLFWEPFSGIESSTALPLVHTFDECCAQLTTLAQAGAKPYFFVHPGYELLTRFEQNIVVKFLHQLYNSEWKTTENNAILSPRSLESLCRIPQFPSLDVLTGKYAKQRALLISPGPSLQACLPYLHDCPLITIAALQAVPLLQQAGIRVDYAVIADPNDMSATLNVCHKNIGGLFIETAADAHAFSWMPEKTFLFQVYTDQIHQLLWDYANQWCIKERLATVSEVMLLLGERLGFESFVLLGMDFCWKEERYSYRADHAEVSSPERGFEVQTINHERAWTMFDYFQGYRYMKHRCSQGVSAYQYTEGLAIPAAHQITPQELTAIGQQDRPRQTCQTYQLDLASWTPSSDVKAEAKRLLTEAAKDLSIRSRQPPADQIIPDYGAMRYFEEIPPERRKEVCLECVANQLR